MYNLGNTHPHTVTDMVVLLEKHLERRAVRKYIPVPPTGDVLATFADISSARKVSLQRCINTKFKPSNGIPVPPTGDVLATFANISSARKVCLQCSHLQAHVQPYQLTGNVLAIFAHLPSARKICAVLSMLCCAEFSGCGLSYETSSYPPLAVRWPHASTSTLAAGCMNLLCSMQHAQSAP